MPIMKRRPIVGTASAVVASIVLAGSALAAFAGVANGSFEDGTYGGGAFQVLNAGSTDLTGWAITAGSVDWIDTYWAAQDGSKSLDMSGSSAGAINQTLATTTGATYFVSFYLSGNPADAPAAKTMIVDASGAAPQNFVFDTGTGNTVSDMKWSLQGYSFVAASSSTVLTFTSTTAGLIGPALDNVVVTETLPTGANCKGGGWETMFDTSGNMFRNQGDCVSYYATGGKNVGSITP
jgi:choice-of-anchor C domain-containing protein